MSKRLILVMILMTLTIGVCSYLPQYCDSQVIYAQNTEIIYLHKSAYDDDPDKKRHTAIILAIGETIGTFTGIEWGDICHFKIKKSNGEEDSFLVAINKKIDWKIFDKLENDESYIGKKVKVIFHKVNLYIPEYGGNKVIEVMVDLKLVK